MLLNCAEVNRRCRDANKHARDRGYTIEVSIVPSIWASCFVRGALVPGCSGCGVRRCPVQVRGATCEVRSAHPRTLALRTFAPGTLAPSHPEHQAPGTTHPARRWRAPGVRISMCCVRVLSVSRSPDCLPSHSGPGLNSFRPRRRRRSTSPATSFRFSRSTASNATGPKRARARLRLHEPALIARGGAVRSGRHARKERREPDAGAHSRAHGRRPDAARRRPAAANPRSRCCAPGSTRGR